MKDQIYLNAFHREHSEKLKEQLSRQPKASLEDAMKQYDRIKLLSHAARALGSREGAEHWVAHPLDALGGVSPQEHAEKHGVAELLKILERCSHERETHDPKGE